MKERKNKMFELMLNEEIKIRFNDKETAIREADKYVAKGFWAVITDKREHMTVYVNSPLN